MVGEPLLNGQKRWSTAAAVGDQEVIYPAKSIDLIDDRLQPDQEIDKSEDEKMVGGGAPVQQLLDTKEPALKEGRKLHQYIAAGIVGLPALQVGIVLGWTSPMLPYLMSDESFVSVNKEQSSWITSLAAIGALIGAMPSGKFADYIGRRRSILIFSIPLVASWALLIFATNIWHLYVARLLAGIGSGATCVLALMYLGEIAETSVRSTLSSTFAILLAFGILYAYAAGAVLDYRLFAISCGLMILLLFVLSPFLIESPIWLVSQGKKLEATEVLLKLRGSDYDAKAEIALLQAHATEQESKKGGIRDLVGTRAGRKAMTTCLGLMFFQQLSGIDAVLSYTVRIFQMAGSTIDPFIATVVIGLVEVAMSVMVAIIIDKAGRRPLLIISGAVMAICLATLGYYFKLKNSDTDVSGVGWLPLASLTVYNITFSIGYGSIPWTMISELFPPETKGVASSISLALNWALVFAVTKLFPTMITHLGETVTFWIFGGLMILATLFAIFVVPETKGKSLGEIQSKLRRKKKSISLQTFNNNQGTDV